MTEEEDWNNIHLKNLKEYATIGEQQMEDNMYGKTENYEAEGRRESDHRFIKIEENINNLDKDMKEIVKDMVLIKTKIYNGLGASVKSTENKVDYIDKQNKEAHEELKQGVKDLSKKFDKIIWSLVSIPIIYIISEVMFAFF